MPFIANTESDKERMLKRIGAASIPQLFEDIPAPFRFPRLELPEPLSELEVLAEAKRLSEMNGSAHKAEWFLGAGAYNHFIPSVVPALVSRGEFATAYTPYQPEVSQGTLQAIFEYQSMVASLMGMEAANASHYDGATALAEAVLMGLRNDPERKRILVPSGLNPEYRAVLGTYLSAFPVSVEAYEGNPREAARRSDESLSCLIVQWPDFFGTIEELDGLADTLHHRGALLIVHADPMLLGLFKPPGEYGADIVTAEGQSLGSPMSFGGPFLGVMATTGKLVRKMPGRIVGETKDREGRRGFVLTLVAREQHIRREKAVSNICSNQGLSALAACVYLAAMGKQGMKKVAELCWHRAHYAAQEIAKLPGFQVESRLFFKEFLVRSPIPAEELSERLYARGIVAGLPLSRCFPERAHELLVCVTEMNSRASIDGFISALKEAAK